MHTRPATVFHIAERAAWDPSNGAYAPSDFARDGFVHCSRWEQLFRVAGTRFAGRDDLIVLEIDVSQLDAPVRYEDLADEGETFPHVYGPVPIDAVIGTLQIDWPTTNSSETDVTPEFHRIDRRLRPKGAGEAGHLQCISGDTREAQEYVLDGLKSYNTEMSPNHRASRAPGAVEALAVMLIDEAGDWAGGVTGTVHWGWLDVDHLWVSEPYRGRGHGRALLLELERQAASRGARRAWLSTFDFQARGMYEKLGYRVVGEMTDFPPGGAMYWMRKDGLG